jgi:hypothetical protein
MESFVWVLASSSFGQGFAGNGNQGSSHPHPLLGAILGSVVSASWCEIVPRITYPTTGCDCKPEVMLFRQDLESLLLMYIWVALNTIW